MNATTGWDERERNPSGQGAAPLEREGDEIRDHMDRTLDEIQRRLSPQELMDRSLGFFREHGSAFLREAGDTVGRHPVPVLLTGAGIVWLTAAVASSRSPTSSRFRSDGDGSHIDEDLDTFDEFADGHGYATRAYAGEENADDSAGAYVAQLVREQPVLVGALALAAGALLGAALPITEYERRMMGPAHDRAMARASEVTSQQYDKVRDAVAPSSSNSASEGSATD
jgi:hypothetical protein